MASGSPIPTGLNSGSSSTFFGFLWDRISHRLGVTLRLLYLAGLVGIVAGIGAIAFEYLSQLIFDFSLEHLAGYTPQHPGGEVPLFEFEIPSTIRPYMLVILPSIGGLISGFLVLRFAPEAAGHGTDAAIEAYHTKDGFIRSQVPIVKLFASAITISTGGSGGREGPIAQIGAGFGSWLAGKLRLTRRERRVLMAAGMGAGIGAIFRAPLAGAMFASEVLYRDPEFEGEVIVPAGVASCTAFSIFAMRFGTQSLFTRPDNFFTDPRELILYLILAFIVSGAAMIYVRLFYGIHDFFHRAKLPPISKPIIGAFITGLIGVGFWYSYQALAPEHARESLAVMSYGYGILQDFLNDEGQRPHIHPYSLAILFCSVAIGKMFTTSFTIGSGGSGGVFGPSMVIGGCLGGSMGILFHDLVPWLAKEPASYMLVGMAGFFTAAGKTPFSTVLMVSEMTGNYNLLTPSLMVCLVSYLLSSEKISLFRSQVASPLRSPAHRGEYVRTILANVTVDRFFERDPNPLTLRSSAPLSSVIHQIDGSHSLVLPVTDEQGKYLGMICLEEIHIAAHSPDAASLLIAADLMRDDVIPLHPGDSLYRAMELFGRNELRALPIVRNEGGVERVIGIVRRSDVQAEYLKHLHGEPSVSSERPMPVA